MDLGRFITVVWRFKLLLGVGLALASLVGLLSLARVSFDGGKPSLSYREQETWTSASTLLITQSGFPWGRAILDDMIEIDTSSNEPIVIPKFGDPARYSGLAGLYAELAKSDAVQAEVMKGAKPGESVQPMIVAPPGVNSTLPLITLKGLGPTPESAQDVAIRASKAFRSFLDRQQKANDIPEDKQVQVVVTQRATTPELFEKRSTVRPIFLFLLINIGFLALAFALENLRPRQARRVAEEQYAELWDWEAPNGHPHLPATAQRTSTSEVDDTSDVPSR